MIEAIFITPTIVVIVGVLVIRFAIHRKPLSQLAWGISGVCGVVAFYAPLVIAGVWIPDFSGKSRVLGQTLDSSGQRLEVVQFWNHVDFYSTELVVTRTDGRNRRMLIDGDSKKSWAAGITVDEATRSAVVTINGVGYPPVDLR